MVLNKVDIKDPACLVENEFGTKKSNSAKLTVGQYNFKWSSMCEVCKSAAIASASSCRM